MGNVSELFISGIQVGIFTDSNTKIYNLERDDGRHDVFFSHSFGDVVGNGAINAIDAPTTQQHQLREIAEVSAQRECHDS